MEAMRNVYKILVGNLKGRDHSKNLGADGRIILDWIFEKEVEKLCTGCIWLGIGTSGGLL
jgi:hypothetical protein